MKILLTRERLCAGATYPAGFNKQQAIILGVPYPLEHGWTHKIINTMIEQSVYDEFMNYKGMTYKKRKKFEEEKIRAELESQEYAEFVKNTLI